MGREAKQQPRRKLVKITNTGTLFREKISKYYCFSFYKRVLCVLTEGLNFEVADKILGQVPFRKGFWVAVSPG